MVVGIGHFQCILNRKREGISQIEACKIANAGEKSAQMQTQITIQEGRLHARPSVT